MLDKVIKYIVIVMLAAAGAVAMHLSSPLLTDLISTEILQIDMGIFKITLANVLFVLIGLIFGAVIGYIISPYVPRLLRAFSLKVERQLNNMPVQDVVAGVAGLAIGLLIADLLGNALSGIPYIGRYLPVICCLVLGYLGIHITIRKQKELAELIGRIPRLIKEKRGENAYGLETGLDARGKAGSGGASRYKGHSNGRNIDKLLDTSVIIDGRIADICRTGFIDGKLLIPVFVLEELQRIADSADPMKRTRGRRGLDILQTIRDEKRMEVEIINQDFDDITEVDSKLVRLGQLLDCRIITNDFNLNKVSELRGVHVLNINDLANSVKPAVIPGERMRVNVVREGKEPGQGLAYLDDGTMIVIENGKRYINNVISIEVTTSLQTSAGRMIFAKPAV